MKKKILFAVMAGMLFAGQSSLFGGLEKLFTAIENYDEKEVSKEIGKLNEGEINKRCHDCFPAADLTALEFAIKRMIEGTGSEIDSGIAVIKLLVENGANPNQEIASDEDQEVSAKVSAKLDLVGITVSLSPTPLHIIARRALGESRTKSVYRERDTQKQADLLIWLIQNGANPNIKNKEGKTPYDIIKDITLKIGDLQITVFNYIETRLKEKVPEVSRRDPDFEAYKEQKKQLQQKMEKLIDGIEFDGWKQSMDVVRKYKKRMEKELMKKPKKKKVYKKKKRRRF